MAQGQNATDERRKKSDTDPGMETMRSTRRGAPLLLAGLLAVIQCAVPAYGQHRTDMKRSGVAVVTEAVWVATGSLQVARVHHSATLLQNGKVLVAGGAGSNGATGIVYLDSAELYDPATGAWTITGRLNEARGFHSATLLPDGRVLVAGGIHDDFLNVHSNTAEIYDPATGAWSRTGDMVGDHSGHTATLLYTGAVLVAGGFELAANNAELYDPASGTWKRTGAMANARYAHTATLLPGGNVLVAGGANDLENAAGLASVEQYNPATGAWLATGRLAQGRNSHSATLLRDGRVLIAGGLVAGPGSAELYDPVEWISVDAGMINGMRFDHTASLLPDGDVLVAGGFGEANAALDTGSAFIFAPGDGRWNYTGDLGVARGDQTATVLRDGRVLVAGGRSLAYGNVALGSAELYGQPVPSGTIGPAFTGAWYDPAQSGHGIFLQILPNNAVFLGWFAFDPSGTHQAWFGGIGSYAGDTITISAVDQPTGGRWIPNFDPSQIVHNPWGSMTLTFTDCNHGRVDFNSTLGYGSGSMNLTRLTQPEGLTCSQ
jgi:hypothetical protein